VPPALRIDSVAALEILDSRGNPTLAISLKLDDGRYVEAGVPSGASTGSGEAAELRDGDPARFDNAMIEMDGTPAKSTLGANAMVGVSMAVARAFAVVREVPLYVSLGLEPALEGVVLGAQAPELAFGLTDL
jgi:enolase